MENDYSREYAKRLVRRLVRERAKLPSAKAGDVEIVREKHAAGETLTVVGFREAIFAGRRPVKLVLDEPTVFHKLVSKEHGVWMSDLPCELLQMWRELAVRARGDVLVGGLGLGVLPRMLERKKSVKSITVVEKSPEVIELISPHLGPGVEVVRADIYEYAKNLERTFTCALLDTWQGTGEWVWQTEIVPLRRALACKIAPWRTHCWAEETAAGQISHMLFRAASMPAESFKCPSTCHYYAFRKGAVAEGLRSEKPEYVPERGAAALAGYEKLLAVEQANREDPFLIELAREFLWRVGTPNWEKIFGRFWDEARAEGKEKP